MKLEKVHKRPPLPDFKSSYTHSCNNLASYEAKKNPDPSKRLNRKIDDLENTGSTVMTMVQKKSTFQDKKDHKVTLEDLKTQSRPNLDEDNIYFQENLDFRNKFTAKHIEPTEKAKTVKLASKQASKKKIGPVRDTGDLSGYQEIGYTPKKYAQRPKSAVVRKYDILRKQPRVSPIVPDYVKPVAPPSQVVEMHIEAAEPPKQTSLENDLK